MPYGALVFFWVCFCSLSWVLAQPIRDSAESAAAWKRFQNALLEEEFRLVLSDPRARLIDSIGQNLARQSRRPIPWRFALVEADEPNAACTGEGSVYVTTSLLDLGLTNDELAGVLAHEVVHGARQHVEQNVLAARRIGKTLDEREAVLDKAARLEMKLKQGKITTNEYDAEMEKIAREARRVGREMNQAKSYVQHSSSFSHSQEREADMLGLDYALACGYAGDGLLHALEKLQASRYKQIGERALLGSSTHPPLPQRVARLKELLRRKGY